MRLFSNAFIALTLATSMPALAQTTDDGMITVLYDNFNRFGAVHATTPNYSPFGSPTWTFSHSGVGGTMALEAVDGAASVVVESPVVAPGYSVATIENPLSFSAHPELTRMRISVDVNVNYIGGGADIGVLFNTNNWANPYDPIARDQWAAAGMSFLRTVTDLEDYRVDTTSAGSNLNTVQTMNGTSAQSAWHTLTIDIDAVAETVDFYLDGALINSLVTPAESDFTDHITFLFDSDAQSGKAETIDNLRVEVSGPRLLIERALSVVSTLSGNTGHMTDALQKANAAFIAGSYTKAQNELETFINKVQAKRNNAMNQGNTVLVDTLDSLIATANTAIAFIVTP